MTSELMPLGVPGGQKNLVLSELGRHWEGGAQGRDWAGSQHSGAPQVKVI